MREPRLTALARDLGDAWAGATAIPAPTRDHPDLSITEAYSIQDTIVAARVETGRRRAGWKLGLTSAPPPATPIVGSLLDDMVIPSGSELDLGTMVAPMVEAEVLVRIGADIAGEVSVTELQTGPHEVGAGLEVIDYRTIDSQGSVDWVADNSTVAYAIVGRLVPVAEIDAAAITAELWSRTRRLGSGEGAQVMGTPLAAVAWLSGHLPGRGLRLSEGDVILTGSLTGHHRVIPPDQVEFSADFGPLGAVSVTFHSRGGAVPPQTC